MEGRGSDESCFRNPSPETFQEQKAVSKEREGGREDGKKKWRLLPEGCFIFL